MKKIGLFLLFAISFSINAQSINPLEIANNNGIQGCDDLITKTFSYFGDYKDYDNNLETKFSQSLDGSARSVRYYFNLGFDQSDYVLGDVVVMASEGYCASYTHMSFTEDNSSCESLRSSGDWVEDLSRNGFSWLSSGGVKALYMSYNDNRSCKITFFMSDVEYYE